MRTRAELLSDFESLPLGHQSALEMLSVVYHPTSRTEGLRYVTKACISFSGAQRTPFNLWKAFVLEALEKELLVEDESKIQCNPLIVEPLARHAERQGRLQAWVDARHAVAPDWRHFSSYTYHANVSLEDVFEDLRLAIHLNDSEGFRELADVWYGRSVSYAESVRPMASVCFNPYDEAWLASRLPEIRDYALSSVVLYSHFAMLPIDEPIDLLKKLAEELGRSHWGRIVGEHYFLTGNLEQLKTWAPPGDMYGTDAMQGGLHLLLGDDEAAVKCLESAHKTYKRTVGRRDRPLPTIGSVLYTLALLRTGDGRRIRQARAYLNAAARSKVSLPPQVQADLQTVIGLAEGKVDQAGPLDSLDGPYADAAGFDQLFHCMVLFWMDKAVAREASASILDLRRKAVAGGYGWIAAECDQLLFRLDLAGNDPAAEGFHKRLGVVSLLDTIREEQPWERGLGALERLSDVIASRAQGQGSTSRLTWRLTFGENSVSLNPFEQKASKTGKWSQGRAVALKRLHERKNLSFMTAQDVKICEAISFTKAYYGAAYYYLDGEKALESLVGHPLVFREDDPTVRVDVERNEPELRVEARGADVRIRLEPQPPDGQDVIAALKAPSRLSVTVFGPKHREIFSVLGSKGLAIPKGSEDRIARAVSSVSALVNVHSDIGGGAADAEEVPADSTPSFHLTPYETGLQAEVYVQPFAGGGPTYAPGRGGETVFATVGRKRMQTRRDLKRERRRLNEALAACPALEPPDSNGSGWLLLDPEACLELLVQLQDLGDRVSVAWPKGESMKVRHKAASDGLALKIRKQQDWFSLDGDLRLDANLVLGLRELLDRIGEASGRFIPLGNNEFLALTDRFRRQIADLATYADRHGKGLRFHSTKALALEGLVEEAGSVKADQEWKDRLARFRDAQALDPAVPSTLQAELRDYQVQGFQWAARLAAWGAGACLADDMGLGKTLQALAVALARAPDGPALVVAPTSVCANWIDEARRFAPTLKPSPFGSGDRERKLKELGPFDLLVCSYGLLHHEAERLASVPWAMIVLDEAQAIKNRATMRSRAAMKLNGSFRMITTGTPIENHLGELWNLFNFINPGLLGSAEAFAQKFGAPIQQQDSWEAKGRLKQLIQPFILRRTKTAVLDELPARTEITLRIEMTDEERALYEAVRQRAVEELDAQEGSAGQRHLQILAEIMKLRRACCHPRLVVPDVGLAGSKLETFSETVAELLENGHKALVFSQFIDHLRIVREHLDAQGLDYRYLDGSTPARERKRQIDRFQAGEGDLFLISLRAGGQGLNLTAADYVIHLDPWWNPAVEDQASDRAHRIGQTRPVTIYRLVMQNTIEEKIVELHGAKRDLADNLLDQSDMSGKMSADELLALLRAV